MSPQWQLADEAQRLTSLRIGPFEVGAASGTPPSRDRPLAGSHCSPATRPPAGPVTSLRTHRAIQTAARRSRGAHTEDMSRIMWTIVGVVLVLWLASMAIGWIFAMLKTFLIIGLIAVVVFIVVSLLAKRPRRR